MSASPPPEFKKPPLHLRCAVFHGVISPSILEKKSPDWLQYLSKQFPRAQQRKDWKFEIDAKRDRPKVTLDLIPVQERLDKLKRTTADVTSFPDRVMIRLQRQGDYLGSFEELESLSKDIVPKWQGNFDVQNIKRVELTYVNLLCKQYTPHLIHENEDGTARIQIGKILKTFHVPGTYTDVRGTYQAEITLHVKPDTLFHFQVNALQDGAMVGGPPGLAIQVSFRYDQSFLTTLDFHGVLGELRQGHNLHLEQFKQYFTQEALASFI